jgi:hypothetical protein
MSDRLEFNGRNDKLKEALIRYREAVSPSSPTLPRFGGYVGSSVIKNSRNPFGVETD